MAGGISLDGVGFGFDNDAGAAVPDEFDADEVAGDGEDIALEEVTIEVGHGIEMHCFNTARD